MQARSLGQAGDMRDERVPALLVHIALGAATLYWIVAVVRCGEDECMDRPVVASITALFWLAGAVVLARTRGAGRSQAAIRWAAATIWLIAAAGFLLVVSFVGFDLVYN